MEQIISDPSAQQGFKTFLPGREITKTNVP